MKRKRYTIKIDGNPVATRTTWNAALQATPQIIRDALVEGEIARRDGVHSYRHATDGGLIYGNELWTTTRGRTFNLEIERVELP